MSNAKKIEIGTSKRLEDLYKNKKSGLPQKPKKNNREAEIHQFNEAALNYSSSTLGVIPRKYK